jgi:hypothetical protein
LHRPPSGTDDDLAGCVRPGRCTGDAAMTMAWEAPTVPMHSSRTFEDDFLSEDTGLYVGVPLRDRRRRRRVVIAALAFGTFFILAAGIGLRGGGVPPARVPASPIETVVVTPIVP